MSSQLNTILPNVVTLDSPNCGYKYAEITTVLRNKIMLYDGAPHGYYIAPHSMEGDCSLFNFVNGQNAMNAYHEFLQSQRNSNMLKYSSKPSHHMTSNSGSSSRSYPVPMRTGQISSNNSIVIDHLSQIQSFRMAGPNNNTRANTAPITPQMRESDINSLLRLEEINIGDGIPARQRKAFYYLCADVDDTVTDLEGIKFLLIIDTGSSRVPDRYDRDP
ncbi:hypothetical protein F5878DRAFT_618654 [Lentinula raphanica]|uniref:Uncharacterized protein n=1 Tax=Lentinula raphanica TaxID=153919 RepID=A0AA38P9B9_9AGAR|nr:hypothetical protein F5878DRAFT_618654 [Lentinula raphanica]